MLVEMNCSLVNAVNAVTSVLAHNCLLSVSVRDQDNMFLFSLCLFNSLSVCSVVKMVDCDVSGTICPITAVMVTRLMSG